MRPTLNGNAAEPMLAGIRQLFRAYAMGPMLKAQTQQQADLNTARAYQAQMAGNQSAANTDTINYLLQLRQQARNAVPQAMTGLPLANTLTLQASGKPYEPYTAIGHTGAVLDRTTGQVTDPMDYFRQAQQQMNALRAAQTEHARAQAQKAHREAASPLRQWDIEQKKADVQNKWAQIAAREQTAQKKQEEKSTRTEEALVDMEHTLTSARALLNDQDAWYGVGRGSDLTAYFNGSSGAIYRAKLDNLQNQYVLQMLAKLKTQSSTGATGYGNMNIKEFQSLRAAAAPVFDPRLSVEQHRQALQTFIAQLEDTYQRMAKHHPQAAAATQQRLARPVNKTGEVNALQKKGPPVGEIEDGYRYLGGNPANPHAWESIS